MGSVEIMRYIAPRPG